MKGDTRIRTAFERDAKALSLKPSIGLGTAVTRVRLLDGYACEIEDGEWSFRADMSEKSGGTATGPNPGVFGRAALGSCLTMTYAAYAAKHGMPLSGLEVEVQGDYDARGFHNIDDVEPGYVQVRYVVTVESDAAEDDIMRWLDEADAHCDFLFVFAKPQNVRRDVRVVSQRS